MIKIENKELINVHTITSIEILDGNISMKDRYASFPVRLYDQNGNFFSMTNVEIQGNEYDAWNSDDYIEDLILSRLEMVKVIEPEPVVEVVPEATPEATPEVTPEVTPELTQEEIKMKETASGTADTASDTASDTNSTSDSTDAGGTASDTNSTSDSTDAGGTASDTSGL
jgi:hypothetical protein